MTTSFTPGDAAFVALFLAYLELPIKSIEVSVYDAGLSHGRRLRVLVTTPDDRRWTQDVSRSASGGDPRDVPAHYVARVASGSLARLEVEPPAEAGS